MKKGLIIGGVSIVAAIAVIVVIVFATSDGRALRKQLDLGYKYLQEMDYEQAIAAFNKAIEIDPTNEKAYIGMADAYVAAGRQAEAFDILDQGITVLEQKRKAAGVAKLKEKKDALGGNADFVSHNVQGTWMEVGEIYDYKTCGYSDGKKNPSVVVNAYIRPLSYEITDNYNGVAADDGYEWRVLESMFFVPCNETSNGTSYGSFITDYYNTEAIEPTWESIDDDYMKFVITYNGNEYTCKETGDTQWHNLLFNSVAIKKEAVMVPKGYDGMVMGFYNNACEYPESSLAWEIADTNMLMFRFGNDNTGKYSKMPSYIDLNLDQIMESYVDDDEYTTVWTLNSNFDCVADYEQDDYINKDCPAYDDYPAFHEVIGTRVETNPKTRISNPSIPNGVAMFFVNTEERRIKTVQNATHGSSGSSHREDMGLIIDFNLGLVYSGQMYLDSAFISEDWGEDNWTRGDAYPIIYEADGGIDLAKNFHWAW